MRFDRFTAAFLFAAAAGLGCLFVLTFDATLSKLFEPVRVSLIGAACGGIAGALAGPLLGSEARRGAPARKGAALGIFVAWLGWVLLALALALTKAGSFEAGTSLGVPGALLLLALLPAWLIIVHPPVVLPFLVLGAAAGTLFYRLRRRAVLTAV